ncbi:unnamed protein product [Onchocerca flexuosa]|uniref:Peptidyl-prolyl cis-trans isomerase n=1 Tax=Onchocerca flexuosa TaxID=387005 RepID=A0A3P7X8Q0_9BILA|nr:unnamed protein product [Onchocerca flexuosa]
MDISPSKETVLTGYLPTQYQDYEIFRFQTELSARDVRFFAARPVSFIDQQLLKHLSVTRGTCICMSVTLQTTLGDIKIELYCDLCPKTCENFLALCASGYYDNCIFHRNIKDFMVQTGDPTGTGKGGDSIWGGPIEDELNAALKHDARGVVSMAGNGSNTSRSQFFITYAKHPTLDLKYTVFGRFVFFLLYFYF